MPDKLEMCDVTDTDDLLDTSDVSIGINNSLDLTESGETPTALSGPLALRFYLMSSWFF